MDNFKFWTVFIMYKETDVQSLFTSTQSIYVETQLDNSDFLWPPAKTPRHCSNHDNKVSQLQVCNKTIYYTVRDQILPSREYKETRYKEIKSELLTPPSNFQLIFLEMTSLGFVTKNIKTFRNFLRSININERYLIEKLQEVVIRCLYFIYCRRIKKLERA